ncbi:ATP-dependent DNA helicase RecQ-like [Montipora capricornis]|uniref:ATP-dependent DNA helicase RecQ-like n=1 Tax=Montipora capricornis TaxID=246305 RepID=UPI0035F2052B
MAGEPCPRTTTSYIAALNFSCATLGIEKFHEEQQKAIDLFFEGKDIFVSLPNGNHKLIIFELIRLIASALWKKACTIFIVSPLKALMQDQVNYLNGLGLKAIALTEDSADGIVERVMNGEYLRVYGSPESFLAQDTWRDIFSCNTFKTHLVGVAIDEAHCISHWGLPGERSVPFHEWFGNLGSLIPQDASLLVVTATATKKSVQDVLNYVEVWRIEDAVAIVNIMSQRFGDMNEIAELGIESMEEIAIDWEEVRDNSDLLDMAPSFDNDSFLTDCDETLTPATSLNTGSFLGNLVDNLP